MNPATLSGSIHEEIAESIDGTPTARLYSPHLETLLLYKQLPDDPDWLAHARAGKGRTKLQMTPTSIPSPYTQNLDGESRFPWRFVAKIGQSGWDHVNSLAISINFEFDECADDDDDGHDSGITPARMQEVQDLLIGRPGLYLSRSTGGKGLHARLYIVPTPCHSRDEYLRLREHAVPTYLSEVGIDPDEVDLGGRGILWIWRSAA